VPPVGALAPFMVPFAPFAAPLAPLVAPGDPVELLLPPPAFDDPPVLPTAGVVDPGELDFPSLPEEQPARGIKTPLRMAA
jgi:hypothetical protein